MIMSNEYIRQLKDGANIVLHIIPLWSLEFGNLVDFSVLDSWTGRDPFRPMSGSGYDFAYCADGKYAYKLLHPYTPHQRT